MISLSSPEGVQVLAPLHDGSSRVLTYEALEFVAVLESAFGSTREELLVARAQRQSRIDSGDLPNFLPETEAIRASEWHVAGVPAELLDRKVEITGPASDKKMVINALNSGASTYMADFEDSQSPTWRDLIQGQVNMMDAVRGTISFVSPEGKRYSLGERLATLIVRPRGLHLAEKHVVLDGRAVSASIFDFGLYLFHNAEALQEKGSGPYFYLPKLESHLEARLWERVCSRAEDMLGLQRGTIKVTVLIETLSAAFEMDEILYELRDRVVGLNCGRWDYIFSFIKKLSRFPEFALPDRAQVTMDKGFLAAYVDLLIKTCHRRGAYAIGGMSAYIPVRGEEESNALALKMVRADKEREVRLGHDGTWVAHPGLVPLALEIFNSKLNGPNQLCVLRQEAEVSRDDLLRVPEGSVTEAGIRTNVSVFLRYLESWLGGRGCVPINNLMEDAATAEICRAQLWQWAAHGIRTREGGRVTTEVLEKLVSEEASALSDDEKDLGARRRIGLAAAFLGRMNSSPAFPDFFTLLAYDELPEAQETSR
jgi:malate synthase